MENRLQGIREVLLMGPVPPACRHKFTRPCLGQQSATWTQRSSQSWMILRPCYNRSYEPKMP